MAAKRKKTKAASKKPAKSAKGSANKKSASKPAKKAAAKKPAAKKATAKKAAKPAKTAKPAKAAPVKAAKPAKTATPADGASPAKPSLQADILAMARELYGNRSDAELLALDPNDIDEMDPSMFYELIQEKFGVKADPDNDYFGGFGGPIQKMIAFVESRWDGKTRKDTPTPPGDWLEEYVHPATDKAVTKTAEE
jgi:hypothetical protein